MKPFQWFLLRAVMGCATLSFGGWLSESSGAMLGVFAHPPSCGARHEGGWAKTPICHP